MVQKDNTKGKGWHEAPKPINTNKGFRNVAPDHYAVSKKKEFETTLRQPLVMVTDEASDVKIVEKAIEAQNPIEQFQSIRYKYQGKYTVIRETFQNSARAGVDRHRSVDVVMTFTPTTFKIEDNGGGVTKYNIDKVFKMGTSGWTGLTEGTNPFGEGFLSFILLFGKAEVISNDVNAEFDWDWIEEQYKKDKNFNMSKAYKVAEHSSDTALGAKDKFIAIFTKPQPNYDADKAIKLAKIIAQTIPVNSVTINGQKIESNLNFSDTPPGYIKVEKKYGEKAGIIGYFKQGIEKSAIRLYFQGAPVGSISDEVVDNLYYDLPSIEGNVNILHTFYGDPNQSRDAWLDNGGIERTVKFIRELAKEQALSLVEFGNDSIVERYQHFISEYTTFDEIKYRIHFNVIEPEIVEQITKVERALNKDMNEAMFKQHMAEILKSPSKLTDAVERARDYSPQIDQTAYNEKQKQLLDERARLNQEEEQIRAEDKQKPTSFPEGTTEVIESSEPDGEPAPEQQGVDDRQEVIEEQLDELKQKQTDVEKKQKSVQEKIDEFLESRGEGGTTFAQWKKETFWCDRKEVEEYADSIKMAGYYKINVAISENRFQKQGFQEFPNFHHISELESSMTLVPTITLPGARNAQERRIEFIIRAFLDASGFNNVKLVIANIVGHRVLTVKNTRKKIDDEIGLVAYAEGSTNTIYLQRAISFGVADGYTDYTGIKALYPYLAYNDYSFDNKSLGQGDIAVFSKIRKTIAHELAHIIKHTKDDTADHFKAIVVIDQKFDAAIAELKAASRISDSLVGLTKKARDRLGVKPGDTVVVTVTKGSEGQVEKQIVPELRKTTLKDIYREGDGTLHTYKELIGRYDNIASLQQKINEGWYKFIGYKVGDNVLYKNFYGEEKPGILKGIGTFDHQSVSIVESGGSTTGRSYPWANLVKVLERQKPKYKQNEIFIREDGTAKTYKQIIAYYDTGDFPIESGSWKQTGMVVGDKVELIKPEVDENTFAIIKGVESGTLKLDDNGYVFYRDVREVKPVEPYKNVARAVEQEQQIEEVTPTIPEPNQKPVFTEDEQKQQKRREELIKEVVNTISNQPPQKKEKDQMSIEDLL